jgi:hypothetical protein
MVLEFVTARVWIDFEPARAATGLVFGLAAAGFVDAGTRELCSRPGRRRRQAAMVGNVE